MTVIRPFSFYVRKICPGLSLCEAVHFISILCLGECSLDPLKKLVVEIITFLSTLGSLETDSG